MKRSLLFVVVLASLLPACRTAGPKLAPGAPGASDPLRGYLDELRLLPQKGDKRRIQIGAGEKSGGPCTVAVRVRAAAFVKGSASFSLETLGVARTRGREPGCRRLQPEQELVISGLSATAIAGAVDAVLQTPEAFLATNGIHFDRSPGPEPVEVASNETFATSGETLLGQRVTAWPAPLVTIDPWFRAPSGRVRRQQSELEVDAVVGTDGRLHRPQLRTSLSTAQEGSVLRSLRLWRFEPARRAEAPVAARVALRPVLHIY